MDIEIIREINKNTRQVWEFNVFDFNKIVFVGYSLRKKPFTKRIWRIKEKWSVYGRKVELYSIKEPELQKHIKDEALKKAESMLRVITWSKFKNY